MNRSAALALVLLAGFMSLAGCVKAPIEGRQDPYQPNQVNFAQEDLRRDTAIEPLRLSRDAAGLLFVTLPIRAATNKQLYVDYRVTFLDRNGQLAWQSGWLNKTLAPNVFDQIQANSLSSRAADVRIDLRWAQ
jgi:hypothetical protein